MARRVSSTRIGRAPRRWPWVLFVLLLVVPTAEVAIIVGVGRLIGFWPTVLLLIVESALGAWLVKREGARAWAALAQAINTGRMPSRQLADAALVLVGGTLLLTPGFLTDVVGFFCILPVSRVAARRVLEAAVSRRLLAGLVTVRTAGRGDRSTTADDIIEGEIIEGEIIDGETID